MNAGHDTAATREERAEIDLLRDEADRAAADAARTFAALAGRLSPRNITGRFSPRTIAARLGGKRSVRIAAAVLPVAAVLAVAAVAAARRPRSLAK